VFFLAGGLDAAEAKPEGYGEWTGPVFETPTSKVVDLRSRRHPGRFRDAFYSQKESEFADPVDDLTLVMEVWKARIYHYGRDFDPDDPSWLPREFVEGTWLPKGFDDDDHSGSVTLHGLELLGTRVKKDELLRGAGFLVHRVFRYNPPGPPKGTGKLSKVTDLHLKTAYALCQKEMPVFGWKNPDSRREWQEASQLQVGVKLAETPGVERKWNARSVRRVMDRLEEEHGRKLEWPPDETWPDD